MRSPVARPVGPPASSLGLGGGGDRGPGHWPAAADAGKCPVDPEGGRGARSNPALIYPPPSPSPACSASRQPFRCGALMPPEPGQGPLGPAVSAAPRPPPSVAPPRSDMPAPHRLAFPGAVVINVKYWRGRLRLPNGFKESLGLLASCVPPLVPLARGREVETRRSGPVVGVAAGWATGRPSARRG